MKAENIRKNKRLTQFNLFKQVIIANKVNPLAINKKTKEEDKTLLEFL